MKKTLFAICILASAVLFMPSANAAIITYEAFLSGPNESPPVASPGTGFAEVVIDDVANTMYVNATFQDLIGTTTASHIHAATALPGIGTAGVATQTPSFTGFPLGVTAGTFEQTFDLTDLLTYRPGFVADNGGTAAGAEAALLLALADGKAYFNIHTSFASGGEIRGFLTPASVPEPSTMLLLGSGLLGLVGYGRKRMKK